MTAYRTGFRDKCSSQGIDADALVKRAQHQGLATGALSALMEQPVLRDAAASYGAAKLGDIAKLLSALKLLKANEGPQVSAIR